MNARVISCSVASMQTVQTLMARINARARRDTMELDMNVQVRLTYFALCKTFLCVLLFSAREVIGNGQGLMLRRFYIFKYSPRYR